MTGNSAALGPFPVMVKWPHEIYSCKNHARENQCSKEAGLGAKKSGAGASRIRSRSSYRIQDLLIPHFIGNFCLTGALLNPYLLLYRISCQLRHVATGAPVIKGSPATAEATATPGASATTEMQNYPASDSDPSGASDVVLLCQITGSDPASLDHCSAASMFQLT